MSFLIRQTLIYAVPLMIVALAGIFAERSGIINLALEGIMIFGAFIGVLFVRLVQQWGWFDAAMAVKDWPALQGFMVLAMAVAALFGALFSLLLAFAAINLKADQTIGGTALNLMAPALVLFFIRLLANQNTNGVAEFFAQLGYTMDVQSGYWADGAGKRASLRLLVYTGSTYKKYAASLIQQQLASQGIEVQILETDDFDAYRQQITDGQFDLYIGEIKLYNNMDLSPFFSGGAASAHLAQSETLSAAYGAFRANKSAAGDFEAVFAAEMPYIPLLWRSSTVVAARGISGLTSSLSDVFYSLDGLRFGNS